jgi:hypothetical protein
MAPKSKTVSETKPEVLMLGFLCVKDAANLSEMVSILDRFGLADSDIAAICNCGVQAVRDGRLRAKKKVRKA